MAGESPQKLLEVALLRNSLTSTSCDRFDPILLERMKVSHVSTLNMKGTGQMQLLDESSQGDGRLRQPSATLQDFPRVASSHERDSMQRSFNLTYHCDASHYNETKDLVATN